MAAASLADQIADMKRQKLDARAALARSRAEQKQASGQEAALARQWVLPQDERWNVQVGQRPPLALQVP